jgi:23S rRNA (uracil1939-C5)-methyltransferase
MVQAQASRDFGLYLARVRYFTEVATFSSGDHIEAQAAALDEDGRGVAHLGEQTLLVTDLLPGERALVSVEHCSPHRPLAWGRIERRLGPPSRDRTRPSCPGYGRCGGCAWQHLGYSAQLREKRRRLEKAFGDALPVPPVAASPRPIGYRNRGKYVIAVSEPAASGARVALGAYQPRSHRVVDTLGCRAVEPPIDATARRTRELLEACGLSPYDEQSGRGELRYAVVRCNWRGELLVALVTRSSAARAPLESVAAGLLASAGVRSVHWVRNDAPGGVIIAGDTELIAGDPALLERVAGLEVAIGPGEFLQVNRAQAERMYHTIADWLGAGPHLRAIDLFAGVGGISFALAARGAEVVAVESDARAVHAGARAGRTAYGDRVRFTVGDAADLSALSADFAPSAVVVDPPRKGLGARLCAVLGQLAPPALVYASCNPDSLVTDLVALTASGYRAERVQGFDMMPGTGEIETLLLLRR